MGLSIDIAVEHPAWTSISDIEGLARRAIGAALIEAARVMPDGTELSLVLCDNAFIQGLNRDWRGKDKPTNVLSFPSAQPAMLGDIVVAYETAAREAADEGKSLPDHLTHLIVHGTLHLLGYDHETDAEGDVMEQLEIEALMRLGIASPFEDRALRRATP